MDAVEQFAGRRILGKDAARAQPQCTRYLRRAEAIGEENRSYQRSGRGYYQLLDRHYREAARIEMGDIAAADRGIERGRQVDGRGHLDPPFV